MLKLEPWPRLGLSPVIGCGRCRHLVVVRPVLQPPKGPGSVEVLWAKVREMRIPDHVVAIRQAAN